MQAALKGAEQIGFTLISLTFSLIAVLIPLLFMTEVVGRLFREFAITLAVSILISLVVSLTLTPMMCARLLSPRSARPQQRRAFPPGRSPYVPSATGGVHRSRPSPATTAMLRVVLRHQPLTPAGGAGHLRADRAAVRRWCPRASFPQQDTGLIQAITLGAARSGVVPGHGGTAAGSGAHRPGRSGRGRPCRPSSAWTAAMPTLSAGRIQIALKPHDQREPARMAEVVRHACGRSLADGRTA